MENKKVKAIGYVGIVCLFVALVYRCNKPGVIIPTAQKAGQKIPAAYILKPEEKAKIIVDTNDRRVTVVSSNKIQTFTGVRHATIIEKKDGTVEVRAKQYGFCIEPGLGAMVSDRFGIAADLQFFYWKSFGVNIGGRLWPSPVPFLAISYSMEAVHLPTVSVYAGFDWKRYPSAGLRVRV